MQRFVNTFNKGIDKDTNVNKYSNKNYQDAENIRLIVNEENGNGAVTNLQGISLSGYFVGETIVGTTTVNDKIIIFTKVNPTVGRIYYLTESQLRSPVCLIQKNFSFGDYVEIIARYQNSSTTKIWWVDGINALRSCNLEEGDATYWSTKNLDYFDIYSNINLPNVVFNGLTGGNLKSGSYQYVYALYSPNKAETAYTNSSTIIPITSSNVTSTKLFKGDVNGTISNKGISISITGALTANPNYSRIRIARLFYSSKEAIPIVDIVYEGQLSDNVTFNDTGNSLGTLVFEDVTKLPNIFVAKTLETKFDYLFAGNIDEERFDIDIDMRMYQFPKNSSTTAYYENYDKYKLGGINPIFIESNPAMVNPNAPNSFSFNNVPVNHNLLNLANVLELDDKNFTYKENIYKNNSSVIGGTGKYGEFSITFSQSDISNIIILDDDYTTFNVATTSTLNYQNPEYYEKVHYQSDEIYRFAFVFRDLKGRTSFAKWCADIRMPITTTYKTDDGKLISYIIDVKFTMNSAFRTYIANNYPDIVSFQIVRCERGNEGTVIDTGYITYLVDGSAVDVTDLGFNPVIKSMNNNISLFEYITPSSNYSIPYKIGDRLDIIESSDIHLLPILKYDPNSRTVYSQKCYNSGASISYRKLINEEYIYPFINEKDTTKTFSGRTITNRVLNTIIGARTYRAAIKGKTTLLRLNSGVTLTYDKSAYCLKRSLVYPYGGYNYASRSNSTYIPCTDSIPINTSTTICVYGGDTFISNFEQLRGISYDVTGWQNAYISNCIVESPINFSYTTGKKFSQYDDGVLDVRPNNLFYGKYTYCGLQEFKGAYAVQGNEIFSQEEDFYGYNSAYTPSIKTKFFPKPLDFVAEYNYSTRIYRSGKKFNSEISDSWSEFKFNNFIDLDNTYGDLTKLILHNNNLIGLQPKAISIISVEPREMIPSEQGSALTVATGGVLDRYDYITNKSGSNFQRSVLSTMHGLYYYDGINKKICRLGEGVEYLSDSKGIQSLIGKANITEFYTLYHPIYKEVWFNYKDSKVKNITYNEYLQAFISRNSIQGEYWFNMNGKVYFLDNATYTDDLDVSANLGFIQLLDSNNRTGYTIVVTDLFPNPIVSVSTSGDSSLTLIINPNNVLVNRFDILELTIDSINETPISSLQLDNSYLTSGIIALNDNNFIRRFRTYRFNQMRGITESDGTEPRFIDTHLKVKLNFTTTNDLIKFYDVITTFEPLKLNAIK